MTTGEIASTGDPTPPPNGSTPPGLDQDAQADATAEPEASEPEASEPEASEPEASEPEAADAQDAEGEQQGGEPVGGDQTEAEAAQTDEAIASHAEADELREQAPAGPGEAVDVVEPLLEPLLDGRAEPFAELPLAMMLESLLLVADEPVTDMLLAELTGSPQRTVTSELERLSADYTAQERGLDLRQVAGGWRIYTRAECAGLVERFVLRGQTARMTQAALETLAVVAYRQPVTRGRVAAVRGVNVDGVMRTLFSRGLIDERGSDPESSATLYGTTELFLERLGLRSLEELPSLAPLLPDLESLEYGQDSIST